jgi:hypothetical protein
MVNMRIGALVLSVAILSGCASGVKFADMNPELSSADPNEGRIFIYRKTTLGAAVKPKIRLNEEVVGVSTARGFIFVDRPAGDYVVATSTEVKRNLSFVLEPSQTRYVRQKVNMGFFVGHVYSELVEEEEALKDLESCKYIGTEDMPL